MIESDIEHMRGGPFQYSSSSEGPDPRDLVDRHLPPLPQDDDASGQTPPSPRSTFPSSSSLVPSGHDTHSGRSHRRSHRRSKEGHRDSGSHSHGSGNRDMVKTFVNEQYQGAQTKRYIRIALERLDSETKRAQEAERRALELADRFRAVNEARVQAQTDLVRANEELRLWKTQYENAQNELRKGQQMLRDVESQRDDAEASAAEARSVARKIREKHLVLLAREEGRKQGYEEGLKRAREEMRAAGYRPSHSSSNRSIRPPPASVMEDVIDEVDEDIPDSIGPDLPIDDRDVDTLDRLPLHDFPEVQAPTSRGRNAPGSRFREHGISPATTNASLYPQGGPPPVAPPQADPPIHMEMPTAIHPIPIHDAPPHISHPQTPVPPDGYIPRVDENSRITLPPPHELDRPPPSSPTPPLPIPPPPEVIRVGLAQTSDPVMRDYAYHGKGRSSPRSIAESIPSTTISQFDLVNSSSYTSPKSTSRNLAREQGKPDRGMNERKLSTIHETSFSDSNSPGIDHTRIPDVVIFPSASPAGGSSWGTVTQHEGSYGRGTPRSRQASQRLADELRYDNPEAVEEWRRSTSTGELNPQSSRQSLRRGPHPVMPSPLAPEADTSRRHTPVSHNTRPRSPSGPRSMSPAGNLVIPPERSRSVRSANSRQSDRGNHTSDSGEVSIQIEPPSGPASIHSTSGEHHEQHDLLSPNNVPAPLPSIPEPEPEVPTVPNSPATRNRYPSLGMMPSEQGGPPFGFMPTGPPVPYSNVAPGASGGMAPPLAHSSPRQPTQNIYGWDNGPRSAPLQRSSTSTPTAGYGSQSSKGRHGRSVSTGQFGTFSSDSLRSQSGRPPSARPPSAGPSQRVRTPSYETAPTPPDVKYPLPPARPDSVSMSPASVSSRLSGSGGHKRSLSMNAGSTPATSSLPLTSQPAPKLRRVPSAESINSATSKGEFAHYQPNEYLDPAFLASSEDLTSFQSPTTAANTRANATRSNVGRSSSPAASFSSSSLPRSRVGPGPSRLR